MVRMNCGWACGAVHWWLGWAAYRVRLRAMIWWRGIAQAGGVARQVQEGWEAQMVATAQGGGGRVCRQREALGGVGLRLHAMRGTRRTCFATTCAEKMPKKRCTKNEVSVRCCSLMLQDALRGGRSDGGCAVELHCACLGLGNALRTNRLAGSGPHGRLHCADL